MPITSIEYKLFTDLKRAVLRAEATRLFKKPTPAAPFRFPMQGYYAGTLSKAGAEAWETLR